jgi:hypothetical protein
MSGLPIRRLWDVTEAQRSGKISSHRLGGLGMRQSVTGEATIIPATSAQLNKLTAELGDLGIAAWIQYGSGLRPSEALAVRLDSFRDGGMVLRVSGQVSAIGRGTAPLKARRPGAYRDVHGTEWLWRKVTKHVEAHGTDDGRLVSLGCQAYRRRFVRAAKTAGLPDGFLPQ